MNRSQLINKPTLTIKESLNQPTIINSSNHHRPWVDRPFLAPQVAFTGQLGPRISRDRGHRDWCDHDRSQRLEITRLVVVIIKVETKTTVGTYTKQCLVNANLTIAVVGSGITANTVHYSLLIYFPCCLVTLWLSIPLSGRQTVWWTMVSLNRWPLVNNDCCVIYGQ